MTKITAINAINEARTIRIWIDSLTAFIEISRDGILNAINNAENWEVEELTIVVDKDTVFITD